MTIEPMTAPLTEDEHGTIRVGGTRVLVDLIIGAFQLGHTAEDIADSYPSITVADVYATITYYLQNRQAMDAYLAERKAEGDRLQREIEARPDRAEFRERLMRRAKERGLL